MLDFLEFPACFLALLKLNRETTDLQGLQGVSKSDE